jgi:hypothetical protein
LSLQHFKGCCFLWSLRFFLRSSCRFLRFHY